MWPRVREIWTGAWSDFRSSWRTLAFTDAAYKAFAFAVLTPAMALLFRYLLSRSGSGAVADADIARFLLTTPAGIFAVLFGCTMMLATAGVETGCLLAIGLGASRGAPVSVKRALAFGAANGVGMLRVTAHIVVRAIAIALPFLAAIGGIYLALVRQHDINYYLAQRPPAFWLAAGLAGVIAAALAVICIGLAARWAMALPLLLFEEVHPRQVLAASSARSKGNRGLIALIIATWAIATIALNALCTWMIDGIARLVAPHLSGSVAILIFFLAGLVIAWAVFGLAVSIVTSAMFSLLVLRIWLHAGSPAAVRAPEGDTAANIRPLQRRVKLVAAAALVLFAAGVSLLVFFITRGTENALVIAHRGGSVKAPENTLAAFRQGIADRADYVELDVQESLDGEVLVIHDSDLMKVGGSPMKIWEHTAAELRSVDIGSHKGSQFRGERVPTLAEALAACKGSARVLVELKSYGHDQQLEERVAALVEAAGMQNACTFMSLDHNMVRELKRLRPSWRVGVLIAKALGDTTAFGGDFLAVEARTADLRFIRRAHRAGKQVYVWTLNDPAWMLAALTRGADGMITDNPALAREVAERRNRMTDAERLLVALMIRAGARTETLEAQGALRP